MIQSQNKQLTFYKVPFLEQLAIKAQSIMPATLKIIGLVDASGSMEPCWEWLTTFWNKSIPKENLTTITFSNQPRLIPNNQLNPNILFHGGQGTEIVPAFMMLEQVLEKIPVNEPVTVIFISDGADNKPATLDQRISEKLKGNYQGRRINFICLGVESDFPTNLSMKLRDLYHRGDPQIPAIYLIEYASEQAFFNKFETMKAYFFPTRTLSVSDFINLFPYDETITKEVYEGQWVIYKKPKPLQLILPNQPPLGLDPIPEDQIEIFDLVDVFRSWIQNLQIRILQEKQDCRDEAQMCVEVMGRIIDRMSRKLEIDILKITQNDLIDENKPFHLRAKAAFIYKYGHKIVIFYDEAVSLAKGVNPAQLTEFEKAKRLMIGTITGKHYQKALALKGITIQEFQIIKTEFVQILKNCKFQKENDQGQERSVITLENQRDIISNPEQIIESLKYIHSQYDFAETFPLIGHGIKVRRCEGSQVNPWIISVESFAQTNKVIDSGYLIKNNFKVEIKVGGDLKEEINCILPLYNHSDVDLQPFLRSRIIKLLMTFMVQQNVDTLYDETYLALMANALIYLFQQKPSQWREEMTQLIFETVKIVYLGTASFEGFLQKYLKEPVRAYFEKEQEYERHVSISKIFIFLFFSLKAGLIQNVDECLDKLLVYHFFQVFKKLPELKNECIQVQIDQQLKQEASQQLKQHLMQQEQNEKQPVSFMTLQMEELKKSFGKYVHANDFRANFDQEMKLAINKSLKFLDAKKDFRKLKVHEKILNNEDTKFNKICAEELYRVITGKEFDQQRYTFLVYHASQASEQTLFNPVRFDIQDEITAKFREIKIKNKDQILAQAVDNYYKDFVDKHIIVPPMKPQEFESEVKRLNVKGNINYNPETGLASNCCFARGCGLYMQPMDKLGMYRHMQNWKRQVPAGFHSFMASQIKMGSSKEQVLEAAKQKWGKQAFPEQFHGTLQQVAEYYERFKSFAQVN